MPEEQEIVLTDSQWAALGGLLGTKRDPGRTVQLRQSTVPGPVRVTQTGGQVHTISRFGAVRRGRQ